MPSYDIGEYYEGGRRRFDEYMKGKRAYKSLEAEKERQWKGEQAALERTAAAERGQLQYGQGSPAMLGAQTGREALGLEREKFGWEQGFKPWQEALQYDISRRGTQEKGIIHGTVPIYKTDEWGNQVKIGEQPYILRPGQGGQYEEVGIIPYGQKPPEGAGVQTFKGGAPPVQTPQYFLPPPMTPQTPPISIPQSPGFGTMRVEGQPGYYGINMPGEGGTPISPAYPEVKKYGEANLQQKPRKPGEWRQYLNQ